jgi:hypothetical protein
MIHRLLTRGHQRTIRNISLLPLHRHHQLRRPSPRTCRNRQYHLPLLMMMAIPQVFEPKNGIPLVFFTSEIETSYESIIRNHNDVKGHR